jgi:hypothetical protein
MRRPPFRMVPDSFIDACASGEINERQFFLGCFILRWASYRTGELSLTLGELLHRSGYKLSDDSLLNDLKVLRPAWLTFESTQGQRSPYRLRLTGLAAEPDEASLPNDFRNELPDFSEVEPPPSEVLSEVRSEVSPASREPLDDRGQPPHSEVASEVPPSTPSTTSSEEDPAVGKTTSEESPPPELEPEFPPLLDSLEPNPFHENGDDPQPPLDPSLGTDSLAELHRRHERGEL